MRRKVNYLNNKDMLREIHLSKIAFCEYTDPYNTDYDIILEDLSEIVPARIKEAMQARAKRISRDRHDRALDEFEKMVTEKKAELDKSSMSKKNVDHEIKELRKQKPKIAEHRVTADSFTPEDIVIRVTTFEHIPEDLQRKKTHRSIADEHVKLNFIPFKHYRLVAEETDNSIQLPKSKYFAVEVLRSHSYNGEFSDTHAHITNKLARMYMLMVNKYSERSNWRGYTYVDEMRGQALLQLAQMGLQFNEAKSDNPFSYYTASVKNSFTRVLNIEKRNQDIRDDLLEASGQTPSHTRQVNIDEAIRQQWEDSDDHFSNPAR